MLPIWVDCDPGHDDALALLLACSLRWFDLTGVSTVYGSSTLENTTNNAMSLLTAFRALDVNVFPGAEKPLIGKLQTAQRLYGSSGLDGTGLLPLPVLQKQPDHTAVAAMAEAIQAHPGELTIVATGPLTNIALLLVNYPELISELRLLSIRGGGVNVANWTSYSEFNFWSDPKAAEIVLTCPDLYGKIMIVPVEVSEKCIATPEITRFVQRGPQLDKYTVFRQMMHELLTYLADSYGRRNKCYENGPPIQDPLAVAAVLAFYRAATKDLSLPDLGLTFYTARATVVQDSREAGKLNLQKNYGDALIVSKIDVDAFWQLVFESINILESVQT